MFIFLVCTLVKQLVYCGGGRCFHNNGGKIDGDVVVDFMKIALKNEEANVDIFENGLI